MIRWAVVFVAAAACWLPACKRAAVQGQPADGAPVVFDLEAAPGGEGSKQWIGTYSAAGKMARFRIDLGAAESIPGKTAGAPGVTSGEGTLLPEPGSDSSVLLADLQKALRAKIAAQAPAMKTSVPFTYVNLPDAGHWKALKLTLGDGDRESEIFLDINPGGKKGRFAMKDARYGDLALAELAKAL